MSTPIPKHRSSVIAALQTSNSSIAGVTAAAAVTPESTTPLPADGKLVSLPYTSSQSASPVSEKRVEINDDFESVNPNASLTPSLGSSPGGNPKHIKGVPDFARANTLQRRNDQTTTQNEVAWRKMREKMRKHGDGELDDVASIFQAADVEDYSDKRYQSNPAAVMPGSLVEAISPAASSSPAAPRQLRASVVQRSAEEASASAVVSQDGQWDQWDTSSITTRKPSASQSFLTSHEQRQMLQLPKEFGGAAKLVMPNYITGTISNVTLPSRLDLLGRRGFKLLGALTPRRIGNAVLGWSPVITTSWKNKEWRLRMQLFHLPHIFSKSMAKILLFLRFVLVALFVIFLLDVTGAVNANPGRVWPFGILLALFVMYRQAHYRRAPDGVMAFCRSMGVPDCEEYMFSYCWKVEPENVRTLAKAVWKAGKMGNKSR